MTADLTRVEIEAMAADIHASHPLHKAITQLLRQLDAARADAAAGQMRVRWVVPHGDTRQQMSDWLRSDPNGQAIYQIGDCILVWANEGDLYLAGAEVRALPLHEEPTND